MWGWSSGKRCGYARCDYLYAVSERSGTTTVSTRSRIVRSITHFLYAPGAEAAVLAKLAAPTTRIVSLTVTEGGYYVDAVGKLDESQVNLAHDLAALTLDKPKSLYGYLASALAKRQASGLPPFTVLSCDNMPENGVIVRKMLLAFIRRRGELISGGDHPDDGESLAQWLEHYGAFPSAMVDRICPRTTATDIRVFAVRFHIADAWPVVCETFRQLVITDTFCAKRPAWESVGIQMVSDVHPYEMMKLRILNASHSALCYLGWLGGFQYVHEVASDPTFRAFLFRLMREEVKPLIEPPPNTNVDDYIESVMTRFANPTIGDALSRICMHGSAKLPKFLLPSLQEQLVREHKGRSSLLSPCVAGWMLYVFGVNKQGSVLPCR